MKREKTKKPKKKLELRKQRVLTLSERELVEAQGGYSCGRISVSESCHSW